MTNITNTVPATNQKLKEAYFTASQGQLIWQRFKQNKSALAGAWVLIILILSGIFSPFLTPYDASIAGRDKDYLNGAPQVPSFCDDNGCSLRPFIYSYERRFTCLCSLGSVAQQKRINPMDTPLFFQSFSAQNHWFGISWKHSFGRFS